MRWGIAALLVLGSMLLVMPACRSGGENAASAAQRQEQNLSDGQMDAYWQDLASGQQALVPRELFVSCGSAASARPISSFDQFSTTTVRLSGRGVPSQNGTRVSFRIAWSESGGAAGRLLNSETVTLDEIHEHGHWRWILPDAAVAGYAQGHCP